MHHKNYTSGVSAVSNSRGQTLMRQIWKKKALYIMLLIPVTLLILFKYLPMYGVQIAFKNYQPTRTIAESDWVGLKYFIKFFSGAKFWPVMKNTLLIGLYSIATFPCAIILAISLNYLRSRWFKKTVQMVSYLPHFITTVVMCSIILQFFDAKSGVFNALMALFGVEAKNYMGNADAFYHIYIWTSIWQDVGYASIIYVAALTGISPELHEAAVIDGATILQRIRHVDLPGILPTMCIMLIMRCGQVLNVGYEKVYLLQNAMNLSNSEVINTYVYKLGLGSGIPQYSMATAIGLFVSVINLIVLVTVNKVSDWVSGNSLW